MRDYQSGEVVVFRKQKFGASPGPRAEELHPARNGDTYAYVVDKFWRVVKQHTDGTLQLVTRRGKEHRIAKDNPLLRRPSLLEKIFLRHKFPPHSMD